MFENMLKWLIGIFYFGVTVGVIFMTVVEIPIVIEQFITMISGRKKVELKEEERLGRLSDDTQIILKQYMKRYNRYGRMFYVVDNTEMFDYLMNEHIKTHKNVCQCDLDDCITEQLKTGRGFIIIIKGEEYIAMPSNQNLNPDCFKN